MTPFDSSEGFPPANALFAAGTIDAIGAELNGPETGQGTASYELQIGYRTPPSGQYVRDGIELTYEYRGATDTVTIPSKVDLCAPKGVTCEHQGK